MYDRVRREIPEFLYDQLVYCDNLTHRREYKCCVLLARNLNFYEFHRKELLHSIDLNNTCLGKEADRLAAYNGPKSKLFKSVDATYTAEASSFSDQLSSSSSSSSSQTQCAVPSDISFGKYVCVNFDTTKLYLLLLCWDKLVVLLRPPHKSQTFRVVAEYEQVARYKLVQSKIKFHTNVEIHYECGATELTNFQDATGNQEERALDAEMVIESEKEFRQLLERVRSAKTELLLHRAKTQKDFERMRDTQTFGSNVLRSLKLEEKQPLTRYGDIWLRLTPDNALVIGIPLMNNCADPNSTVLRNLQPLLRVDDTAVRGLHCQYRLYQLEQAFQNLESLETYFQSEDAEMRATEWTGRTEAQLLPESFGVLLLKLQIAQVIALVEFQLFVLFEVDKRLYETDATATTFRQQIFLRTINLTHVLNERAAYEITFSATTLHQDFLAIAMACLETKLLIRFRSCIDLTKFEDLLVAKLDFEMVMRGSSLQHVSQDTQWDMDIDADLEHKRAVDKLFFNRKPTSLWHGVLAMRQRICEPRLSCEVNVMWKFYTRGKDTLFLLLKILFRELLISRCSIEHIECPPRLNVSIEINEFENAVCAELNKVLDLLKGEYDATEMLPQLEELNKLQMQSDLMSAAFSKR